MRGELTADRKRISGLAQLLTGAVSHPAHRAQRVSEVVLRDTNVIHPGKNTAGVEVRAVAIVDE